MRIAPVALIAAFASTAIAGPDPVEVSAAEGTRRQSQERPAAVGNADGSVAVVSRVGGRLRTIVLEPATRVVLAEGEVPVAAGSIAAFDHAVATDGAALHVVASVEDARGLRRVSWTRSDDGGRTWRSPVPLAGGDADRGPRPHSRYRDLAIAVRGERVAAAWVSDVTLTLWVAWSDNGGASFAAPIAVHKPWWLGVCNGDFAIDFTATGTLLVAFADSGEVWTAARREGSPAFDASRPASGPYVAYPVNGFLDVATPDDGGVVVAYSRTDPSGDVARSGVGMVRAKNDDDAFSDAGFVPFGVDASAYATIRPRIVERGNTMVVAVLIPSGVLVASSIDRGRTFGAANLVGGTIVDLPDTDRDRLDLAVGSDGAWILAWRPGSGPGLTAGSRDGGQTWSSPTPLQSEPPPLRNDAAVELVPIDAGAWSVVHVNRSTFPELPGDVLRVSNVPYAGAPSGPSIRIGERAPIAGYPVASGTALAVAPSGRLWAAWFAEGGVLIARASADRGCTWGPFVEIATVRAPGTPRNLLLQAPDDVGFWFAFSVVSPAPVPFKEETYYVGRWREQPFDPNFRVEYLGSSRDVGIDRQWLSAAPGGRAWVWWAMDRDIVLRRTLDDARTWSENRVNAGSGNYVQGLQGCSDGLRHFVTWRVALAEGSSTGSTMAAWSTDTGTPMRGAVGSTGRSAPAIACSTGGAWIAWAVPAVGTSPANVVVSSFVGAGFGAPVDTGLRVDDFPGAPLALTTAPDAPGTLFVGAIRPVAAAPQPGLATARSLDSGRSFRSGSRLSFDGPFAGSRRAGTPVLIAESGGGLAAAWLDGVTEVPGPVVVGARSTRDDEAFGPAARLDAAPAWTMPMPERRLVAVRANDEAIVAWSHERAPGYPAAFTSGVARRVACDGLPVADAGPDQTVECTGERAATVVLDGSGSSDPDGREDLVSWVWREWDGFVADGETANATLGMLSGTAHEIRLTVTDRPGYSASDVVRIEVIDTQAPTGSIAFPIEGACFGTTVRVAPGFTDLCDPYLAYVHAPEPLGDYHDHGDVLATVTATDAGGNAASASVSFTIDTVAPEIAWLVAPGASIALPATVPMALLFSASDDDGASGGVVHERMLLDGCPIYDGSTYGDGDGLLSDETLVLDLGTLCRFATECGRMSLQTPTLVVEATDCGGNVGASGLALSGSVALKPGVCTRSGATSLQPAGGSGLDKEPAPTTRPRIRKAREGRR